MPLGLPKRPKVKLPTNPLESLRGIVGSGRQQVEKAGSEVRALGDEVRGFSSIEPQPPPRASISQNPGALAIQEDIATACVPCGVGHFAGASKLLSEAFRFKADGITSNQVLDDIAGAIGELNAMERVDLTPEKLQRTSSWERPIAEEALRESRNLRHRLETISSIEEVEAAAADSERLYKKLFREWFGQRFAHLGTEKAEMIVNKMDLPVLPEALADNISKEPA